MACNIEEIYNELVARENITDSKEQNEIINDVITKVEVKGSDTNKEYSKESNLDKYTIKLGSDDFTKAFYNSYKVDIEKGILSDQIEFIQFSKEVVSFMSEHFKKYTPDVELKVEEQIVNDGTKGYNNLHEDTIKIMYDENDLTSSKSEIFLHETLHTLAKDVKSTKPSMFNDLEAIREMLKDKIDHNIFLNQIRLTEGRNEFTEKEIQRAKEKYEYIMYGDIEEFYAYAISNPSLYNAIKNVNVKELAENSPDVKSIFNKPKKISEILMDLLKTIFLVPKELVGTTPEDTIHDLLVKQIHSIAEYQAKMITADNNGLFSDKITELPYIGFTAKIANMSFKKFEDFHDYLTDKLGMTIEEKAKKELERIYNLVSKPVEYTVNSKPVVETIDKLMQINTIKKIVNNELVHSIKRDLVVDTANGKYRPFFEQIRKVAAVVDKATKDLKNGVINQIKNSELYGEDYLEELQEVTDKLINTGVFRKIEGVIKAFKEYDDLDNAIKAYEDKTLYKLTKEQIDHLNALEIYSITGESQITNQQTSVQNILNNMFQYHTNRKRSKLQFEEFKQLHDDLEILLSLRIAKREGSLESLMKLDKKPILELIELSRIYNTKYKEAQEVFLNEDNYHNYSTLAFNYLEPDNDSISNKISLIPLEEYEEKNNRTGFFSFGKIQAIDKPIVINNKKYVKVIRKVSEVGFEEQAFSLTNTDTKGLSIRQHLKLELLKELELDVTLDKETRFKKIKQLDVIIDNIIKSHATGKSTGNSFLQFNDANVIPTYNSEGKIIDYVLPYSKSEYINDLNADMSIMSTLPHTISRLQNVKLADENNKRVADTLIDFYNKNMGKTDKNGKPLVDFVMVSNTSNNPNAKDAWDLLPNSLKTYVHKNLGRSGLPVPYDMVEQVFGSRDMSIVNLQLGNKRVFTDITTRDTVSNVESMWKEIVAKAKTMLILLNPEIVLPNIVSNLSVISAEGVGYLESIPAFFRYIKLLNEYEDIQRELTKAEIQQMSGEDVSNRINVLKDRLRKHPVHVLVQDGQFTPFIDDLDDGSDKGILSSFYRGRISLYKGKDGGVEYNRALVELKAKLKHKNPELSDLEAELEAEDMLKKGKVPNLVGKVIDTLFVNKGTPLHSIATKITLYSDTISRLIILDKRNRDSIKQTGKSLHGEELRSVLNELDTKFVNYTYLQNKTIRYADKVGGLHFLKYAMRIYKGYFTTFKDSPLAVLGQQSFQMGLDIDISDPTDSMFKSPVDILMNRMSDPTDKLYDVATPNLFMPVTELSMNSMVKF